MKNQLSFLLFIILLSLPLVGFAQTPWPTEVYQGYFNQCKQSMLSQRMTEKRASGVCYCMTSSFSKEFGMEQYNFLRSAQPNPNGSIYDRKLHKIVTQCMS
jgi:hypothetical protein